MGEPNLRKEDHLNSAEHPDSHAGWSVREAAHTMDRNFLEANRSTLDSLFPIQRSQSIPRDDLSLIIPRKSSEMNPNKKPTLMILSSG